MTTSRVPSPFSWRVLLGVLVATVALLLVVSLAGCCGEPAAVEAFKADIRPNVELLQRDHLRLYDDAIQAGIRPPAEKASAEVAWGELEADTRAKADE